MSKKEKILKLRNDGLKYEEIANLVPCSKSLVCYYLGNDQLSKNKIRQLKNRKIRHPFQSKIEFFHYLKPVSNKTHNKNKNKIAKLLYLKIHRFHKTKINGEPMPLTFTVEDVLEKFGENPHCYLTGRLIDINKSSTYHFDHIVPRSRGGTNALENLGLCIKEVNFAKRDMTPEEFMSLCKEVLIHNGYTISKTE